MATDVSICSAALMLLGDAPIASLTGENTRRATLCANLYPQARDDILRAHPWNCLIRRVLLAPLSDAPVGGEWAFQFARPGDWLRTLSVTDTRGAALDYVFEAGRILTRANTMVLRYVARADEGTWDSHLVDVMTKRMAADLAYPITKSGTMAQLKLAELQAAMKQAKAVDGLENPPEDYGDSPFIQVRG